MTGSEIKFQIYRQPFTKLYTECIKSIKPSRTTRLLCIFLSKMCWRQKLLGFNF